MKKRIMMFDDSPMILRMAKMALEEADYEVVTTTSLDELESARASFAPDLVLLDVQTPEAFGDDVAMVLRNVSGVDIPIYLFSGLDEAELSQRAADAEIDGYISKKLGVDNLVKRVGEILSQSA